MIRKVYEIIKKIIDLNKISFLLFFSSIFILLSFSGTRLFFSDEGIILDQFYNMIQGSLALKFAKINTATGILTLVGNNLYGMFSYSLLILSLPIYYLLSLMDSIYSAHLFILQVWAFSGGAIVYLLLKNRNSRHAPLFGIISYMLLISINMFFFKPIFFPKWGELLSIEFTNILISSFFVLVVFELFRRFFNQRIGIFAAVFMLIATPISFYAISLKHHSLTLLLTLLAFYFYYKYTEKNENKFLYLAYISTGLCIWTRTLDGIILLASLLIMDILFSRRNIKHIISITAVILISLLPFFGFNYMILGNPFSIIENQPLADKQIPLVSSKYMISLDETSSKTKQMELLDKLGYIWTARIKGDYGEIIGYTLFSRLINTFGVFLVTPFLIIAIAFIIERLRGRIRLNTIDKFFIVYLIVFFGIYGILYKFFNQNYLMYLLKDTPMVLEYRYLLIFYVILLYFSFRIQKINQLIHDNYKKIAFIFSIIFIMTIVSFIAEFPVPFLNIYFIASRITTFLLLILVSASILIQNRELYVRHINNILLVFIAIALAEASMMLLFYYWAVSITYVSPEQNFLIIPVMQNMMDWMYKTIIY